VWRPALRGKRNSAAGSVRTFLASASANSADRRRPDRLGRQGKGDGPPKRAWRGSGRALVAEALARRPLPAGLRVARFRAVLSAAAEAGASSRLCNGVDPGGTSFAPGDLVDLPVWVTRGRSKATGTTQKHKRHPQCRECRHVCAAGSGHARWSRSRRAAPSDSDRGGTGAPYGLRCQPQQRQRKRQSLTPLALDSVAADRMRPLLHRSDAG
jgi:hypothetical protein